MALELPAVTRGLALALALSPGVASAQRPTEGGLWAFEADDEVLTHDEASGAVRVHYTVAGPHAVPLADGDADGVPDYVARVAATTRAAFDLFADELGLRPPLTEAELGLGALGGSAAFDVYLVDFGGAADGHFLVDACAGAPARCAGAFVMENDFAGYAYASEADAIDTVASHELFHAVQAAYVGDLPAWFAEGTAVWAERRFRAGSLDFLRLCDRYLADTGRSLYRPPSGPVPAFAYGTALWWDFLTTRHDVGLMEDLLVAAAADPEVVGGMERVITEAGDALADAWLEFAAWNLATGTRAGIVEGHAYASSLSGVRAEQSGPEIEDEARFFGLTATYYRISHAGGPLWFGLAAEASPLEFALHRVAGDEVDGPVEDAAMRWSADAAGARELAELEAGAYWLIVAHPEVATSSAQAHFCVGDEATARRCGPVSEEADEPGGCRIAATTPAWAWLALLAVPRRRRVRVDQAVSARTSVTKSG